MDQEFNTLIEDGSLDLVSFVDCLSNTLYTAMYDLYCTQVSEELLGMWINCKQGQFEQVEGLVKVQHG